MSCSPALKWFVLLLLPVTLGLKLAVRPGADSGTIGDKDVQRRVAQFLFRQHFAVTSSEKVEEGLPMIQASAGACRVLVAKSPATGSDRDVIRHLAAAGDRIFVVYRGQIYDEQPTWLTALDFLWARLRREIGLNVQAAPVLAVIARQNCGAERLAWEEFG